MDDGPTDNFTPETSEIDASDSASDSPPTASPDDGPTGDAEPERPPLALETALTWLAKIKPTTVLALLRDPEFALTSMSAFSGFRVNATSYATPLVRRRLAQEAIRDEKFADKLQALAESLPGSALPPPPRDVTAAQGAELDRNQEQAAVGAPYLDSPTKSRNHAPIASSEGDRVPDQVRLASLKTERDRRRRERDEARQALTEAEATRQEAERSRQQAETERDEAQQQAQRQAQRVARLERQVAKLQSEQASLMRALRRHETSPEPRPDPNPQESLSKANGMVETVGANPWQAAVAHLIDKRRYDLALSLAEDVLRADPDNPDALEIAAQGRGARGDTREAAVLLRRRLAVTLAQGARAEAGEILLRLLVLVPSDHERDVRSFLSGLRADDAPAVEQTRTLLTRLRGIAPETHAEIAASIARLAPTALAEALMPPPGRLGPDAPLPLGMAGNVSARQLLRAVDTGHVDLVEGARAALSRLGHMDPMTMEEVRHTLERAAGEEQSALVPLLGTNGRGPAVVDGSNAAWFDQESLSAGHPRLRPLLGLRRALHARGYFPVLLYADAPLPYTIDEPDALRAMVAQGELTLVDSGVDADEVLLREAKRFRAPLITNDYMADWDPNNEVTKIRFTLSFSGEAYLMEA